ncbi:NifB/NifX family molybdenum-iron cluster-binding protein [Sphingopyxis chilensis]
MALSVLTSLEPSCRTALLVMHSNEGTVLCPFFSKCDGLLIIDPESGSREFRAKEQDTAEAMCDLILKAGVHRLVLGFIGGPAARKLRAAGIDIRLGSGAVAVEDLVIGFNDLPAA